MVKLLIILVGAIISGILYRCGGKGKPYHTLYRDAGCPITMLLVMYLLGKWHISLLVCAFLLYGALTTYWDFLFNNKDNFYMHGFMCGLAMLPLIFNGVAWWLIFLRAIVLALGMGLLNKYANKYYWKHTDIKEEVGRGSFLILTLPLL